MAGLQAWGGWCRAELCTPSGSTLEGGQCLAPDPAPRPAPHPQPVQAGRKDPAEALAGGKILATGCLGSGSLQNPCRVCPHPPSPPPPAKAQRSQSRLPGRTTSTACRARECQVQNSYALGSQGCGRVGELGLPSGTDPRERHRAEGPKESQSASCAGKARAREAGRLEPLRS